MSGRRVPRDVVCTQPSQSGACGCNRANQGLAVEQSTLPSQLGACGLCVRLVNMSQSGAHVCATKHQLCCLSGPSATPSGGVPRSASLGVGRLADAGALERRRRFADDGLSTGADRLPLCCLSGAGGSNARTIDWRSVIHSSRQDVICGTSWRNSASCTSWGLNVVELIASLEDLERSMRSAGAGGGFWMSRIVTRTPSSMYQSNMALFHVAHIPQEKLSPGSC